VGFWPTIRNRHREDFTFLLHPVGVLKNYSLANLRPDMVAGLTVAVVLLPQAIAYAMIAELPPEVGLYAAIVGAIVGALWGSSLHLHTGPTNASSLLVLASLVTVAQPGTPEFIAAAGYLAVLVGVIKLIMGLARLGVLVNFVADSVVVGFTAGAGILISLNQLKHLLRVELPASPEIFQTIRALVANGDQLHQPSLYLGLGTIVLVAVLKRFFSKFPAALMGMVAASAVVGIWNLNEMGVEVLGAIPRSLPPLTGLPLLSPALFWKLSAGALAVSAIGLVEAISSARTIAARSGQHLLSNQEFVGQGMASIAAGFFSGYTVSGSFTRSAINYEAGGRSPLANVFSGIFVLVAMMVFAPLAVYLPRTALAGVLLVTAYGMVDRREMRKILQTSFGDSSVMISTMLATVLLPLEFAVLAGMLVSFARYLIKSSTPTVVPVVPDPSFRRFEPAGERPMCPQLGIVNVEGSLYFGAVHHVEEMIRKNQEACPRQKFLLLRLNMVDHCDVSGIHMLGGVVASYRRRGGDVFLDGVRPKVMEMIHLYGFDDVLGAKNILNEKDTISHLFHKVLHPGYCVYECRERVFAECQALPKDDHAANLPEDTDIPDHEIEQISPTALKLLLSDPYDDMVLIDVREPTEYKKWHIPGSTNLSLRELAEDIPIVTTEQAVVLVSRIGRRSALAAVIMQDYGQPRVFNLKGGMLAWEAAGFPLAVE
jgi:sulfate permease, SulP family